MDLLEPIDNQLICISTAQQGRNVFYYSNENYDLIFHKDLSFFKLISKTQSFEIEYSIDAGWSFPNQLILKSLLTVLEHISYSIDVEIRKNILSLIKGYPFFYENQSTLDVVGKELELTHLDNGFLRYFWCFRSEQYENNYIPLIRTTKCNAETITIKLSSDVQMPHTFCLSRSIRNYHTDKLDINYYYNVESKKQICFGVGLWLIFGTTKEFLSIDANTNSATAILDNLFDEIETESKDI